MSSTTPNPTREDLLRCAARCYLGAELTDRAVALLEEVEDWQQLAQIHFDRGSWFEAGVCYRNAERFPEGAECFERAGDYARAAQCLVRARRFAEAAWLHAHRLRRPIEAQQVMEMEIAQPRSELEAVAWQMVAARCHVCKGNLDQASLLLDDALRRKISEPMAVLARRVCDWAVELANLLGRPDLAVRTQVQYARTQAGADTAWDQWAEQSLGAREPKPWSESDPSERLASPTIPTTTSDTKAVEP